VISLECRILPGIPAIARCSEMLSTFSTGTPFWSAQLAAWGFDLFFCLQALKVARSLRMCGHSSSWRTRQRSSRRSLLESLFLMALLGFKSIGAPRAGSAHRECWRLCTSGYVRGRELSECVRCLSSGASAFQRDGGLLKPRKMAFERTGGCRVNVCGQPAAGFAFFRLCQLRWGHWDLYMLTQGGWLGHRARLSCSG